MEMSHDTVLSRQYIKIMTGRWSDSDGRGILAPGRKLGRCSRQTESQRWPWRRQRQRRCQIPRCPARKGECWRLGPSLRTEDQRCGEWERASSDQVSHFTLGFHWRPCAGCTRYRCAACAPWQISHLHVLRRLQHGERWTFKERTRM